MKCDKSYLYKKIVSMIAVLWPLLTWFIVKDLFDISDRYLPSPMDVVLAAKSLGLSLINDTFISFGRILIGYTFACTLSVFMGAFLYRSARIEHFVMPLLQSIRAVPATATIPFFLLWFGFSELGKFLIIVVGISFNLSISAHQILRNLDEKYLIAFRGFGFSKSTIPLSVLVRFALEQLLPTLRFSLTVAIALSVVAEYLGAQEGLGYIIQSARSTYALDVIVVCAILYGVITIILDTIIKFLWKRIVPWASSS